MEEKKEQKKEQEQKITFETDDGAVEMYVIDETRINGCNYILVADAPKGDAECLILKDTAPDDSKESVYEEVLDDDELDAVNGGGSRKIVKKSFI